MRKFVFLFILFSMSLSGVFAQQNSTNETALKISISNIAWTKRTRPKNVVYPQNAVPSSAKVNEPIIEPIRKPIVTAEQNYFIYRADFKNESRKKIKGIGWEFIFLSSDGKKELQRHDFYHPYKIGVNKRITVRNLSYNPPTKTVDYKELEKNEFPYIERAEIQCVIFEDDSVWKKSETSENFCVKLRTAIERSKRR